MAVRGPGILGQKIMSTALKIEDMVRLQAEFVLPLVVGDMLNGAEALDDIAEYAIHEILGEMRPDAALLCIALCAANIADYQHRQMEKLEKSAAPLQARPAGKTSAAILGIEAEHILGDYAPLWLAHKDGAKMDNDAIRAQLVYLPEDLEALADLLTTVRVSCDTKSDEVAMKLCELLAMHADAQSAAAEDELEQVHLPQLPRKAVAEGNIVLFPQR